MFAALACGDRLGGGNDSGAGGSGGSSVVACDDAVNGDPCGASSESCGPLDGYGCSKHCSGGTWQVNCIEPPSCADYPVIRQGAPCPGGPRLVCGPFAIDSRCGAVSATAHCDLSFGWVYDMPCDPDCKSLGETDCKQYNGCAWAAPCNDPTFPHAEPRCIDFPPPSRLCTASICPAEFICESVSVNPQDITSGDCTGAKVTAALCNR